MGKKTYPSTVPFFLINLTYLWTSPMQFHPSPRNPGLQVQLYDPLVLLHTASALHLCVPVAHSSISKNKRL